MKIRYLTEALREDVEKKMVFIGGPRQVGKTTLARYLAEKYQHNIYLNWDNPQHKTQITGQQWPLTAECLVFDELHKYEKWKSLIKGIWDTRDNQEKILVTGSSRLDIFRRSGDSLLGRYHYHVLHPFSLREMNNAPTALDMPSSCHEIDCTGSGQGLTELFRFGGFPEPLLEGSERTLLRWQNARFERIFREDIRDTENVRALSQVELLGALLPKRVASPLSLSSMSEDVQASPKSITFWMDLLSRNYYCFRVMPYHNRLERALKKESKYYLWDWSEVKAEGARFENMIASHLLKFCDWYYYVFGIKARLWYIRDRDGREVDFLVTWGETPWFMVECKLTRGPAQPLSYFGERLDVAQRFLVTLDERHHYLDRKTGVQVVPARRFLMGLV
ncbi:ATP-binding protein [Candidatus Electrothrix sp.]|uniref:ATP-binding protein n=1 Tax=Candidatus Electrothrix sp. TaxID=2170559 RepID=UPI00405607A4